MQTSLPLGYEQDGHLSKFVDIMTWNVKQMTKTAFYMVRIL